MTANLPAMFSMSDLERMATSLVKSNMFGIKTVEQAVTLMLVAQAEGLHPATAARDYHVIQGRPAMKADAMLARFQQSGGIVEWQDYTDARVSGTFRHPQSPKPVLIEWTIEMARKIGLASKDNWRNYPRQMLRARVISEGVRTCYPAIATGIYTPEEVQDFSEKDVTPTAGVLGSLPAARQEVINETAVEIRSLLANDQAWDAYSLLEGSGFDADEQTALWSLLDSKQRSALKRLQDAARSEQAGKISKAQHKRLEARIKELGLDRDTIKAWSLKELGIAHFTDLSPDEYKVLDQYLDSADAGITKSAAPQAAQDASPPSGGPADAAVLIAPNQAMELETWATTLKAVRKFKLKFGIEMFSQLPAGKLTDAQSWLKNVEEYLRTQG